MDSLNDPAQPNINEPNTSPANKNKIITIVLSVVLVVGIGSALGYFIYTKSQSPTISITPTTEVSPSSPTASVQGDRISWQKTQVVTDLGLWAPTPDNDPAAKAKYYKLGTFLSGKYQGGDIILADVPCAGPCEDNFFRIAKTQNQAVILQKYSDSLFDGDGWIRSRITADADYTISGLEFPKIFVGPQPREAFELDATQTTEFFDASKFVKVFTDSKLGDVYMGVAVIGASPTVSSSRNGFYVQAADGTLRSYAFKIDFVDKNTPSVIWNDGSKNYNEYVYTDLGGCGSRDYASVVLKSQVNPTTDLAPAGRTSRGDVIYELRDAHHPLLEDAYTNQHQVYQEGQSKLLYADFLGQHPLFFWLDPFNRLIKFQNNQFVPQAECGKPVIYLYPERSIDVSVQVSPKGGLTYSEPNYNETTGWLVHADTRSNLTDKVSGKNYPYLFWEGRGGIYDQPKYGFVVKKDNVHSFLLEKLNILGLNQKETEDFIEFWGPRMQSAPYYFVTFLGNQSMNQIAPLIINPKPDSVIRILMDFSPLESPVIVKEPTLRTPQRNGFTVVEWGGVLR